MKKVFLILFILNVIFFYGCANEKPKKELESVSEAPEENIQQKVLSFNLAGYAEDGKKKWEVLGESANMVADVVMLDNIVATAYGENTSVTLTADKGEYDKVNNKVKLHDNVVGSTPDGAKLNTDKLEWDSKIGKIYTESHVVVEKDNISSEGNGATLDPKFKQVEFQKDVLVKQGATTVTCDGALEVDYEKNVATFNKNVKALDERGEIHADKMKILFDKQTRKLTQIIAEGNVNIIRGKNSTFSQKAVYNFIDGKAVLTGAPQIVIFPEKGMDLDALAGN